MKDLVDIVIISGNAVLKAADLREALPPPPAHGAVPFRQLARIVAIDTELERRYELAARPQAP